MGGEGMNFITLASSIIECLKRCVIGAVWKMLFRYVGTSKDFMLYLEFGKDIKSLDSLGALTKSMVI